MDEFGISGKVTAITMDNASNMDVAVKKLNIIKIGCFAHTLNLGAQSLSTITYVSKWTANIRDVIMWMTRSSMAKTVLRERQNILSKYNYSSLNYVLVSIR